MSKTWQVQDAKARFSEFLEASLAEGPQNLKELLLAPEARTDTLTPPREKRRHRRLSSFE